MATSAKTSTTAKKPAKTTVEPARKAPAKTAAKATPKSAPKAATKAAARTTTKATTKPRPAISTQQRRHYVEVAAYFIAERRGFIGGSEAEDWVAAEVEIDRLLAEGKLNA